MKTDYQDHDRKKGTIALLLLPSRLILFLIIQIIIGIILRSQAAATSYWILTATITNLVSIAILVLMIRREGDRFRNLFKIEREKLKGDLLLFIGLVVLCGPLVFLPDFLLSQWLWGDRMVPFEMMFSPLSLPLVFVLLVLFPVTIAFAELPTYFGYIMPRLSSGGMNRWLALMLPVLFLSLQHCALPFIADPKFLLYRAIVFLPFATLIGVALRYRPRLLPLFAIMHGIMDAGTVIVLLNLSVS